MKRVILSTLLVLVLVAPRLQARNDEPYYCTTVGTTLYYERYAAGKDKLLQTTTMEIESVENAPGGKLVKYALTMRNRLGGNMYGGRTPLEVRIGNQSDVFLDMGATIRAMLRKQFNISSVTSNGNPAVLPANMAPGDTLPESHSTVTLAGINYHIELTNRMVLRRDRVTIPSGTVECVVIRERKCEWGPGYNKDEWNENWYVRGLGYVRHDVFDKNGKPKSSERLVSVTGK